MLEIVDIYSEEISKQFQNNFKIYDHRKKTDIYKQIAAYLEQTEQNVLLFAQDKKTIEKLSAFPVFVSQIKNKTNLEKADQIMFFDYPANDEELKALAIKEFENAKVEEITPEMIAQKVQTMKQEQYKKAQAILTEVKKDLTKFEHKITDYH